jgi:hypothetical protein
MRGLSLLDTGSQSAAKAQPKRSQSAAKAQPKRSQSAAKADRGDHAMRRSSLATPFIALALLIVASAPAFAAQFAQGPDCGISGSIINCAGKVGGLGNNTEVFLVLTVNGGCQTPGTQPQGQTQVVADTNLSPAGGGSFNFTAAYTVTCHGNQVPIINGPVGVQGYECVSGEPTFNRRGQQTNASCTLIRA